MATAAERRLKVRNAYRKYIGRNHYSNARRDYCTKPYKDGKYYSDCSSSVSYAYKEAGEGFGILNTVGMWNSKKLVDVPVTIKNGVIQNPEVLRIGDMLLFAGNDVGRKSAGYVGHVEMVGEIAGGTVTLYGHGSGLGTDYKKLGTVKKGDRLVYDEEVHQVNGTDWYLIEYLEPGEVAPINAWISGKYAKLETAR